MVFIDPRLSLINRTKDNLWKSYDTEKYYSQDNVGGSVIEPLGTYLVGNADFKYEFLNGIWNPAGDTVAFSGLFLYIYWWNA